MDALIKAKSKKNWYQIFSKDSLTKLDIEEKVPPIFQPPTRLDEGEIIRYRKAPDSNMLK